MLGGGVDIAIPFPFAVGTALQRPTSDQILQPMLWRLEGWILQVFSLQEAPIVYKIAELVAAVN